MIKVPKSFIVSNKFKDKIKIKIDYLANHQDLVSQVVNLWINEIGKIYYPDATKDIMNSIFLNRLNINKLPLTMIALDVSEENNQKLIAECSLIQYISSKVESNSSWFIDNELNEEKTSWISGLIIDQNYRQFGIAKTLINVIKEKAFELNQENLIASTFGSKLNLFFEKFGFIKIADDLYYETQYSVMHFSSLTSTGISSQLNV